jgi:CHAT domain-containing protein
MSRVLYLYYAAADFEAFSGSHARAFEYSEALRSRGFLEQMGTEAALRLPGISGERREEVKALLLAIENFRTILENLSGRLMGEDNDRYARFSAELRAAEAELAVLDAAIGEEVPRYGELRSPRPVDIEKAKAWCGDDRAALEYVIWDESIGYMPINSSFFDAQLDAFPAINSYCLVLTKDGVRAVRLPPAYSRTNPEGFDYSGMVEALRSKVFHQDQYGNIVLLDESAFETERNALYNALVKPVLPFIPEGITGITIVPDGALAFLPFDMLRENNGKDTRDFGETYRLSLSPSVSVSVLASETEEGPEDSFLGFGGALYNGYHGADERGPISWGFLEYARSEIEDIGKYFSRPRLLTGAEVSEAKIRELSAGGELKEYSILHFACHGFFNQREPGDSGILLSEISGQVKTGEDGNLTIGEVVLLELKARMVLMSACSTGLGRIQRGDGMVGLARSFMTAGAKHVGVSLWEIDDYYTYIFMKRLYGHMRGEGLSFREAYYRTRNGFRGERNKRESHPYFWAAFTMYE